MIYKLIFIASQEISATFKQHICDMQFADVACALKTQTAIIYVKNPTTSSLSHLFPAGQEFLRIETL